MKTLVLGLGNEFLCDDGVGIVAARALKLRLNGRTDVEVVESSLAGLALVELLAGYERAIIIDAVKTGRSPAGTIYELSPEDLDPVAAPSPHYAGLPEVLAVAKELRLEFPKEIRILAMEVEDPHTIGCELSELVKRKLPELISRICSLLQG
jgi:hydrogenase maturation protease